jgi:hypothetical protein
MVFDDPLAYTIVPMGAQKILLYVQVAQDVAHAELSVNGKRISAQESPGPKQNLCPLISPGNRQRRAREASWRLILCHQLSRLGQAQVGHI